MLTSILTPNKIRFAETPAPTEILSGVGVAVFVFIICKAVLLRILSVFVESSYKKSSPATPPPIVNPPAGTVPENVCGVSAAGIGAPTPVSFCCSAPCSATSVFASALVGKTVILSAIIRITDKIFLIFFIFIPHFVVFIYNYN